MYIEEIKVRNFKSFENLNVHLGKFNVLIGGNASGKSNFVELIRFVRNIVLYGLDNAFQMAGGVEYVRNLKIGRNEPLDLKFRLKFDDGRLGKIVIGKTDCEVRPNFIECDVQIKFGKKYKIINDEVRYNISVRSENGEHQEFEISIHRTKRGKIKHKIKSPQTNTKLFKDVKEYFEDVIGFIENIPHKLIIDLPLLPLSPPFTALAREIGIYNFDPKTLKKSVSISGKTELEEDGSNLPIVLQKIFESKSDKINIIYSLKDFIPFIDNLKVEKLMDKSLLLSSKESFYDKPLPANLISDGTLNVIATLVALIHEEKDVCIFEEPERNIHPALIQKLVNLFKEYSSQKQIILTTHNPLIVKYAGIENILLVKRDSNGFSYIVRPQESEIVQEFLKNEFGLDELFVEGIIGAGL
jgi:predicted ATPase